MNTIQKLFALHAPHPRGGKGVPPALEAFPSGGAGRATTSPSWSAESGGGTVPQLSTPNFHLGSADSLLPTPASLGRGPGGGETPGMQGSPLGEAPGILQSSSRGQIDG